MISDSSGENILNSEESIHIYLIFNNINVAYKLLEKGKLSNF